MRHPLHHPSWKLERRGPGLPGQAVRLRQVPQRRAQLRGAGSADSAGELAPAEQIHGAHQALPGPEPEQGGLVPAQPEELRPVLGEISRGQALRRLFRGHGPVPLAAGRGPDAGDGRRLGRELVRRHAGGPHQVQEPLRLCGAGGRLLQRQALGRPLLRGLRRPKDSEALEEGGRLPHSKPQVRQRCRERAHDDRLCRSQLDLGRLPRQHGLRHPLGQRLRAQLRLPPEHAEVGPVRPLEGSHLPRLEL
mmetsp:Transcript_32555/g.70267  ORF Transcript_32555/g.70267 Transcript_32555/m.70267 type:complete len:249 (+) Transcript_32555:1155-1901(+)